MDQLLYSPNDLNGGELLSPENDKNAQSVTEWLDETINAAIESHDIEPIIAQIGIIRNVARITGMALVHLLGRLEENWASFGIAEAPEDYLYAETGLNKATIARYIKVYKMLQAAPEDVRPQLEQMNVKTLIPIGYAVAQGYELEEEKWKEIVEAGNYEEISNIVREVKGAKPRASGLRLWVNRDGDVFAFVTDEDGKEFRRLICSLPVLSDDPIVNKAVERIIRNTGILAEWET